MNQEVLFAKTLDEVKKTAKENGNMISMEAVEKAFSQMNLGKEQMQLVFEYLNKFKIGIGEDSEVESNLSEEDVDYLDIYLEELASLPTVTPGQKEAITLSAMAGEKEAKARLIEIYLPQVIEVAKLYAGQGAFLEDLIGEGNVALAIGVEMLGCLERYNEAEAMLGKMMMDAMESFITEITQAGEADKVIVEKINRIAEDSENLAEELLRKVTVAELSKETNHTEEEIREAIRISGGNMEYIEEEQNAE